MQNHWYGMPAHSRLQKTGGWAQSVCILGVWYAVPSACHGRKSDAQAQAARWSGIVYSDTVGNHYALRPIS